MGRGIRDWGRGGRPCQNGGVRWLLILGLVGCAEGDGLFLDAGEGLVGTTLQDGGDDSQRPLPMGDAVVPPPPPGCTPGAKVSLCGVCGPDGRPQAAMRDEDCPPIDCTTRNAYSITDDGGAQVCTRATYQNRADANCADIGLCFAAADPGACVGPVMTEVARTEVCQRITGCNAATPPQVVVAPEGTVCEGGVCNAQGECEVEVVEGCEAFEGITICGTGVHRDGTPYCDVDTRLEGGGNCIDVCRNAANVRCILAWQPGAAVCEQGGEAGCFDAGEHLLCRCARP